LSELSPMLPTEVCRPTSASRSVSSSETYRTPSIVNRRSIRPPEASRSGRPGRRGRGGCSSRQIGSTPSIARCSSQKPGPETRARNPGQKPGPETRARNPRMNAIMSWTGGRAPPGQNRPMPCAGSRWPNARTMGAARTLPRQSSQPSPIVRCHLLTPALIPLRLAHPHRSVSALQPIFVAIEVIAAHSEACSPRCSNTIRTARARTSGEYFVDLVAIAPSPRELEPPANPGRFTLLPGFAVGSVGLWVGAWSGFGVLAGDFGGGSGAVFGGAVGRARPPVPSAGDGDRGRAAGEWGRCRVGAGECVVALYAAYSAVLGE